MITKTQKELIVQLEQQGLKFKQFALIHEGDYAVSDADWNYKDVPHLHHVHMLVEAILGAVGDNEIATINVQKVLWFTIVLSVFNYQSGKDRQTYFTSFGPYSLIIETSYKEIGEIKTRVTTNYAIGGSRFWMLFFPVLAWLLKRNYADLMSADIPMRERRGQLRKWGYQFKKTDAYYSFRKTMQITEPNVVPPEGVLPAEGKTVIDLNKVLPSDGIYFMGRSDHLGLQLIRKGDSLNVFPRMCPHEGALLDARPCDEQQRLTCPWHGRVFKSLAKFNLKGLTDPIETSEFIFKYSGQILEVQTKPAKDMKMPASKQSGDTLSCSH